MKAPKVHANAQYRLVNIYTMSVCINFNKVTALTNSLQLQQIHRRHDLDL